jgi:hypothetical protein
VLRIHHTPLRTRLACLVALVGLTTPRGGGAQAATPASPLLDALSITVQRDSVTAARGSMRFRIVRAVNDVELVATGIVVRPGLRVSAELRTDTLYALRKYVAETRDSIGRLIDRVQLVSSGGRVTLERVTPTRRMVREFLARRELMVLDSAALVPYVVLAAASRSASALLLLDVRRGELNVATLSPGLGVDLSIAEVTLTATPVTVLGLGYPLEWWRDARGRLLRVTWGRRGSVLRDDPPT